MKSGFLETKYNIERNTVLHDHADINYTGSLFMINLLFKNLNCPYLKT